ncbi:MAG TPA: malate dehydrogenase [bacterium]|nr:malate dehydrogenase [bacterium]
MNIPGEKKMKIGIIGAGNVGATTAHIALMKNLGDIYLLDIEPDMAKGKAIDLNQSKYLFGADVSVEGGDDYERIKASDIIVITAGLARKPGMSRDDLLVKNFEIIKSISLKIKDSPKEPVVIVVSNPLDLMAYTAYRVTGFPRSRVLGMAGILDTYRFYHFIQSKTGAKSKAISSMILGSHGDTMVPLISHTKINRLDISSVIPAEDIKILSDRARNGGAEIVSLLKTGSAYYAPAASTVRMMEAIVKDENALLPCSVYADGFYGLDDLFIGLPVKLSKKGADAVVDIKLTHEEGRALYDSAAAIKEQITKIKGML